MVDHIHFQYNGFLMGILFSSIYLTEKNPILSACVFTCLVFTKHFFVVLAPVWFVFLLNACIRKSEKKMIIFFASLKVLMAVLGVSAFAITPIIATGQINQFISRLFPISRSFIHFFPASNLYTLYALLDKLLAKFHWSHCKIYHIDPDGHYIKSMKCIPPIKPIFCMVICVLLTTPVLVRLWYNLNDKKKTIKSILISSSISLLITFQFGFHIHEKQILYAILLLGIYAILFCENERQQIVHYLFLSNWSNLSIMVLLETYPENIIKYIIVAAFYLLQLIFFNVNSGEYGFHNLFFILGITTIFFLEFIQKLLLNKLELFFIYHALSPLICMFPILYYTLFFYYYWVFDSTKTQESIDHRNSTT